MILLDTNVISEPIRPTPDSGVIAWIDAQSLETLFISAITVAELRIGVALMPAGKRRDQLHENIEREVLPLFTGRILPFDFACSRAYADLISKARSSGIAVAAADGYIAAIALTNGLSVATRDVGPFEAAGAKVINPWAENGKSI